MAALFPLAHRLWRTLPAGPRRRAYELATGMAVQKAAWTPATPKTPQEPFVVAGPLSAPTGLGEAARLTLGGLVAAGRRVSAIDLSQPLGQRSVVSLTKLPSPALGPGTLLLAVQPPSVAHALALIGRRLIADKLRIGCWIWELDVLPDAWLPQVPLVHALAAPSLFVAEAFRRSFDRPVYLLRYPIGSASLARGRRTPGLPLRFGSALDMGSTAARKNPLAVLRAFRSAFGVSDPVRLTLKIRDEEADGAAMAQLRGLVEAPGAPVEIVTGDFPPQRMEAWWDEIDVFVSLHRSEGFGLLPAEAMLRAIPVIATNWSATAEFVTSETGWPIPAALVPVVDATGRYELPGATWADPDPDAAVAAFRMAAASPETVSRKGEAAVARMQKIFSLEQFLAGLTAPWA